MYLLYLDESGVPERHPDQTSHYVALGVAVHESTWYELEQRMASVREQFGLSPQTELHAKWMLRQYFEQDEIDGFGDLRWPARRKAVEIERQHSLDRSASEGKRRRKESLFRHTGPFIHLTRSERNDLVRAALEVVGDFSDEMRLFGEAINKETLNRVSTRSPSASSRSSRGSSCSCSKKASAACWSSITMRHRPRSYRAC